MIKNYEGNNQFLENIILEEMNELGFEFLISLQNEKYFNDIIEFYTQYYNPIYCLINEENNDLYIFGKEKEKSEEKEDELENLFDDYIPKL